MIQLDEIQRQELLAPEPTAIDHYNPDEGASFINEIMADDDEKNPWLERYQTFGKLG